MQQVKCSHTNGMPHDMLISYSVTDQFSYGGVSGRTWTNEMENDSDLDVDGIGLELVHVSDVLDYLGKPSDSPI